MDFAEMFGVDSSQVFEDREEAEGYLEGSKSAQAVHLAILEAHKNRSRTFREALLLALREQL